jgi:hypothetical protein
MRKHIFGLAAGLFAMIVTSTTSWAAATDAGVVLGSTGEATAKSADGTTRKMDRRSSIMVGDTLMTGTAGTMQIRMKDGAVLALGEGSEFAVQSYSYKAAGDAKDSASLKLLKGTLMQVSGQMEKSAYSLETPVSTLGIRGTTFNISINPNGSVTATVNAGAVVSEAASAAVTEAKTAVATKLSAVTAAQKALKAALLTKKEDEIAKAQAALDAAQAELKIAQTTLNEAKAAVQTEIRAGNAAATTSNGVTTPAPLQTFTAITPAALAEILARAYPDDIVAFVEQLAEAFPDQATAIADGAIAGAPDLTKAIQDAAKKGKDNANLAAAAAVAADEGQGTSP